MKIRDGLAKYSRLLILLATVAVITASGYSFVQQQKQIVIEDTRHELATIADLKTTQIVAWRRGLENEAASIFSNALMARRINDYLNGIETSGFHEELKLWMHGLRDTTGHTCLILYKPDGSLIASDADPSIQPLRQHYLERVEKAVQNKEVVFSELHYDEATDSIHMDLTIPVLIKENSTTRCIAVLFIGIAPQNNLYPLIRTWPSPSSSGETLLVRREGNEILYLNNLRFRPDSALKLRVPITSTEMPGVRAALGQEGVFEGTDYRGIPVYAATRTIPDSPWAIIAKIDEEEMLEPVSKRIMYVVGTCALIVLAISLTLSLRWKRKREADLLAQYEAELEFNRELKQAEEWLLEANTLLEERVSTRTEQLSRVNTKLMQEISERRQAEELLRRHFHVIQQSPNAIIITDLLGTIEFVNPRFSEICGYSPDEVIGKNPRILKSGKTSPQVYKELWDTITSGGIWTGEICNRKKNDELYWEHATILPFKDQQGNITNYMAFKQDITSHKLLEEKLRQSSKLETIGQIAGGVAHEVRNPLNAILSITEALFREKEIEENPEFAPYIQHIRSQVNRLATLMNDLLDLGKPISEANIQAIPLYDLCRETVQLWKESGVAAGRQVSIIGGPNTDTLFVWADSSKLQQVIFNLLENAGNHCPDESRIIMRLEATNSGTVIVHITDSGKGIPEENLSQIFEPFYSNRRGGTGLGLSLVKHFIENMGGSVRIWNNDPPPGCTAELRIPQALKEQM